ncbi:imm11 family protein [Lacrimispora sp.]|uniref:imm11 family protein n=1 Tax=Lacrimispora sp. TaxID=2719234 RepID=UPI0039E2F1B8
MDKIDDSIKDGTNTIYAETTNLDEIVYLDIKKGYFDNIILSQHNIVDWPNVEFYYSSKVSSLESDYLLNVKRWPIIHVRVMEKFVEMDIKGLSYFPIKLVDVVTNNINNNYVLMYIDNFIDAFDMERSKYKYNEKYNLYTFIPQETYLNKKICSQYDIFRCSKSVAAIYASQKIKETVEKNNWTGFDFYKQS